MAIKLASAEETVFIMGFKRAAIALAVATKLKPSQAVQVPLGNQPKRRREDGGRVAEGGGRAAQRLRLLPS